MADNEQQPNAMQDDELDVDELQEVAGGIVAPDEDTVVNNCDCTNNCG